MYDLAKLGRFDKGTVTKAVQKLVDGGYIRCETDEADHRIHHLYTTPQADPVIQAAYLARERWHEILTEGLTKEEVEEAGRLLGKMAENAHNYMNGGI